MLFDLNPFVTMVFAYLFMKERIGKIDVAALTISFLGVYLVSSHNETSEADKRQQINGLIMAGVSGLFMGLGQAMMRVVNRGGVHPIHIPLWEAIFSIFFAGAMHYGFGEIHP